MASNESTAQGPIATIALREEFETAQSCNVPTFVLIEKSVHAEYFTFQKNKDNVRMQSLSASVFARAITEPSKKGHT